MKITDKSLFDFYNQKHLTNVSKKGYYSEKVQFITENLSQLAKNKKLKILDIACNEGTLTKIYGEFGDILGVDMNKQSVLACRKKGIACVYGDIDHLGSKYFGKFDVVIAGDIIEHIFNTDNFLNNIKKFLKPGGTLLLTTANVASIGRRIMMLFGKNPFLEYSTLYPYVELNVGHIRYYTVLDMKIQLLGLGFKNVRIFGDKINLSEKVSIPYVIAKHLPNISRYMFVRCEK